MKPLALTCLVICVFVALILGAAWRLRRKGATAVSVAAADCNGTFQGVVGNPFRAISLTDSGMHAIWSPPEFAQICDYASWEKQLLETADIERHIRAGAMIPLYLHADGVVAVEIRVGSAAAPVVLTEKENSWVVATSEDYLFVSQGIANLSGIEYIDGSTDPSVKSVQLAPGRYTAKIHLLEAPVSERTPDNLYPPDFLVLMHPEAGQPVYRTSEDTFTALP